IIDSLPPMPVDSIVHKITNNQTFTTYTYSMIVAGETRGGIHNTPITSSRIILGTIRPYDNVPPGVPSGFVIERSGDYIRLNWNQVMQGINGLPELKPHENIRYYVYRYTQPYGGSGISLGISDTTFFIDTNLFGADVVGDTLNNYYWSIYAVDYDGNTSSFTYRVGEIDFVLKSGWSSFGIPLEMFGITNASGLSTLIPSVAQLARYRPGTGWSVWNSIAPGYNNFGVAVGDGIWAYVPVTGYNYILTIVGKVPSPTAISYNLRRGNTPWNVVIVPLHFTHLTNAAQLCGDIPNATSVARWVPVSGTIPGHWEQWVPALPSINNFPVRPGAAYFVAVSADTVWPTYVRGKGGNGYGFKPDANVEDNLFGLPAIIYGEISGETRIDATLYIEGREEETIKGRYVDGNILFQLGELPSGWKQGEIAVAKIKGENTLIEKKIKLTGEPYYKFETENVSSLPKEFALKENYPNPFNAKTIIRYDVPRDSKVEIAVYNVLGKRIKSLIDGEVKAGYRTCVWDGTSEKGIEVSSGVYFVRMRAEKFEATRSILFLK
ncbi:MAG: T9SS type A sorting domain-containing protein, partial [bacterium]